MTISKHHKNIPLDHLTIDPIVQRAEGVDQRRVKKMAAAFDSNALGTFIVSERNDGTLVCLDGAHRQAAGQLAGYTDPVDCTVFTGLSISGEASLFLLYNDKKDPSAISRFKARVVAGDEIACEIATIVEGIGWKISLRHDIGYIGAVERLESVYRTAGGTLPGGPHPIVLGRVLRILTNAWEYDPRSVEGSMLYAIGQIIGRYGEVVDDKAMSSKLQRHRPGVLIGRARALKEAQGGTVPAALAKVVVGEYNSRRRQNPLPEWMWVR